jgi:hypothetical protein
MLFATGPRSNCGRTRRVGKVFMNTGDRGWPNGMIRMLRGTTRPGICMSLEMIYVWKGTGTDGSGIVDVLSLLQLGWCRVGLRRVVKLSGVPVYGTLNTHSI